ncbi:MAG TPA: dihydropteroate synthase [Coriobacteriia bacterium]
MDGPQVWRCGGFALDLARPLVMGILNVTPDSFSDGGSYIDRDAAVTAAVRMLADGADVIDVGGESTRPGAEPVTAVQEAARVAGVIAALAEQGACVSVDTRHALVASEALSAGASIVNDVSGFTDPEMVRVAADSDAGLVVMHTRGEPRTMQEAPAYADVVAEVAEFLSRQAVALERAGVARDRIAIDPGIGFGKTTEHNLALLRRLPELEALGFPVLVGASRKRFIGEITGVVEPQARVAGSVAAALEAVRRGAAVVRVHDVAATVQALAMVRAVEEEAHAR